MCSLKSMELGLPNNNNNNNNYNNNNNNYDNCASSTNSSWLNPGETATPSAVNFEYLKHALSCVKEQEKQDEKGESLSQTVAKSSSDTSDHSYSIITNSSDSWKLQKILVHKPTKSEVKNSEQYNPNYSMVEKLLNAILDPEILAAIAGKVTRSHRSDQ